MAKSMLVINEQNAAIHTGKGVTMKINWKRITFQDGSVCWAGSGLNWDGLMFTAEVTLLPTQRVWVSTVYCPDGKQIDRQEATNSPVPARKWCELTMLTRSTNWAVPETKEVMFTRLDKQTMQTTRLTIRELMYELPYPESSKANVLIPLLAGKVWQDACRAFYVEAEG